MSTSTEGVLIPDWDLADRLNKALKVAKMSVHEMAEYLGVHRNTVSAWINDRTPPDTRTIRLWALRTGVPFEWLRDGDKPDPPDHGGHVSEKKQKPPLTRGSGKPVGWAIRHVIWQSDPVKELLGHASVSTTQRYVAVDDEELRAVAAAAI